MRDTPYEERTDLQKIQTQWNKLTGLHSRLEWSSAIVRAATGAEIAANYAIRAEFAASGNTDVKEQNKALIDANGLRGKIEKLLKGFWKDQDEKASQYQKLRGYALSINDKRNDICHRGVLANEDEATQLIYLAKEFIVELVKFYEADFVLEENCSREV